jgi:hypothetical protein
MPFATKALRSEKLLRALLPLYIAASLLHFSHNAQYLRSYPNLPAWISRANICVIWLAMTAIGCLGFLLYRRRRSLWGLIALGLYAVTGMGGLLHYTRASFSAHSATMNFTILLEASIAAALLTVTVVIGSHRYMKERDRPPQPDE